ncbi:MAG TPA: hypothetical protein VM577_04135 [Anaerovoracaceae bacterium]|nr:hypothetical protein [Anaerovoracaceae bacterium]
MNKKTLLRGAAILGIAAFSIFFFGTKQIVAALGNPGAYYAMVAISLFCQRGLLMLQQVPQSARASVRLRVWYAGFSHQQANALYGQLSGMAEPVINI